MPRNMKTGEDFPKWHYTEPPKENTRNQSKKQYPIQKHWWKTYDWYSLLEMLFEVGIYSLLVIIVVFVGFAFEGLSERKERKVPEERLVWNVTVDANYEVDVYASDGNIGNDLRMSFTFNGEPMSNHGKTTITEGEKIIIVAKIIEDDDAYPDVGTVKIKYRMPDAISRGDWFLLTSKVKVAENHGNQYSKGAYEVFDVSFKISVK